MSAVETCPLVALLKEGGILRGVSAPDKMAAITAIVERMSLPPGVNRDQVLTEVLLREGQCSTALGNGVAIPHPRNACVLQLPASRLTLAFLDPPVDFDAPDGVPVKAVFLLLSCCVGQHLRTLAHLGRTLQRVEVQEALARQLATPELLDVFARNEYEVCAGRAALPVAG